MKRWKSIAGTILLTLFVGIFVGNGNLFAQRQGRQHFGGKQHAMFWAQLTEAQQQQMQEKLKELRGQNATRAEINAVIKEMLTGFGIKMPDNFGQRQGRANFARGQQGTFGLNLTDEQRTAVRDKIKELRQAGKTPAEIHTAAGELLQSFGITLPDNWAEMQGRRMGRGRHPAFMSRLTDEQRKELREKTKAMRDEGKTPAEIHAAAGEMLQSFGVTLPDNWAEMQGRRMGRGRHPAFMSRLTDEQRKELREKTKAMRDESKTPAEIHAAVGELLQSFGVTLPDNWDQQMRFHGRRGHKGTFWAKLTQEQRTALREKIKAMKDSGAKPAEIRKAVREMLQEFGINPREMRNGRRDQNNRRMQGKAGAARQQTGLEARNYPNPFNPETNIEYTLQNPEKVTLRIYNVNGQVVRTLLNGSQSAGTHTVLWNGRNERGAMVPSGLYFYRIDAGKNSLTQGMILMK